MTSKPRTAQKRNSKASISPTADLLVEIGSEELPWQMIQPAVNQLAQSLTKLLEEQRIAHGAVRVFCTPRRLTVAVMGVSQRQIATSQEVLGPSKSVAFDTQGQPTRAALGFAKSQGLDVAQLEVRDTPKGAYVCAVVRQTAKATSGVLNEHLPQVIEGLTFPKTMRWNASGVRFPRPIRWMVVLLGTTVIKVNVASVPAGKRTWGHRFIGTRSSKSQIDKGLEVKSPGAYEATLERAGVIANPDRRRSEMQKLIKKLAKAAKGDVYPDNEQELLEQAVFSLEYPNILCGKFDRKYLALPQEVLITAMKEHQGFFSVVDPKGKLLARFLAPTNMNLSKMDLIRVGNERVLAARLADAQYFFDEDRKRKLADRVNQLAGVVFHKKIGTLYQKTERTISLVGSIAVAAGFPGLKESAQRAGLLSKTDLLTGMVGEFPTLQGLMGRHYAEHDGELEDVYVALGEYYQPRTPDDVIHQGFFSVVDPKGKLLARFLAPTNMNLSKMDLIRVGNERVLAARLADAQYFFDEDRKRKLADRVNQLAGVVFHKKIGTLYQKTERTISLVGSIAVAAGFPGLKESAQRAGLLSKTDLLTGMVGEFPTLQGLIGRHYAEHDGESEDVYVALGEYYQPRTPDDVIPRSPMCL